MSFDLSGFTTPPTRHLCVLEIDEGEGASDRTLLHYIEYERDPHGESHCYIIYGLDNDTNKLIEEPVTVDNAITALSEYRRPCGRYACFGDLMRGQVELQREQEEWERRAA